MLPSEFSALCDETFNVLRALHAVKSGEYAADTDKLANFREASRRLGITPEQVLLVYLDKHYSAIANFIRDRSANRTRPRSEPIEGRIHDAMVYLLLLKALLADAHSVSRAINTEPRSLSWDPEDDDAPTA